MPNIDGFSHGMAGLDDVDDFTRAYIEAALWSSTDELTDDGGEPMDDRFELSSEVIEKAVRDCKRFREVAGSLLDEHPDPTMGAHDFWLTRNGHGAGFWDGDWPVNGDVLSGMVGWQTEFGEVSLYVGDDGKVYQFDG